MPEFNRLCGYLIIIKIINFEKRTGILLMVFLEYPKLYQKVESGEGVEPHMMSLMWFYWFV
jgi:hypothetical protein